MPTDKVDSSEEKTDHVGVVLLVHAQSQGGYHHPCLFKVVASQLVRASWERTTYRTLLLQTCSMVDLFKAVKIDPIVMARRQTVPMHQGISYPRLALKTHQVDKLRTIGLLHFLQ